MKHDVDLLAFGALIAGAGMFWFLSFGDWVGCGVAAFGALVANAARNRLAV